MEKSVHIKTFGCQMNVYDSARMMDVLRPLGYREVDLPQKADLIILNTCHIREKAAEKVFSDLGRLRSLKESRANTARPVKLAVAGCVAKADGDVIFKRAPYVDLVFGPQNYHQLPVMLSEGADRHLAIEAPEDPKFDALPETGIRGTTAFLAIQEGCNNFCTYCVVPYTRGREYSRPAPDILKEAGDLAAKGVKEIMLLGQNVDSWHSEDDAGADWRLGRLIRQLAEEQPSIDRIRYTTSHPRDMDMDLISAHKDVPALMPFVHLPIQSGSASILKAMNRNYTLDDYRRAVDMLREARPDIALASDFIVGFPGETDKDFEDTLSLVKDIGYAQAYSFKYSPRPGTPAAKMDDQIDEAVKKERLARLQDQLNADQLAFNEKTVGKTVSVLLDGKGAKDGQYIGRTPHMQSVHLQASADMLGSVCTVTVEKAGPNSLSGRLADMTE